ncbi:archaeosortase/exosortase family protein [bacterium]|nr:archaeosortase/exosortase family protein [bacterium]
MTKKLKSKTGQNKESKSNRGFRGEFTLFVFSFFSLWILSYILIRMNPSVALYLQKTVAKELAFFLNLMGYDFDLDGSVFAFHTAHGMEKMYIIAECTGIYTTMIFLSIIGAFPAKIGGKLIGLLLGVPAIHILNMLRMIFISLILYHKRSLFHFFHGYFWQVGFVAFMLILVFLWMSKFAELGKTRSGDR